MSGKQQNNEELRWAANSKIMKSWWAANSKIKKSHDEGQTAKQWRVMMSGKRQNNEVMMSGKQQNKEESWWAANSKTMKSYDERQTAKQWRVMMSGKQQNNEEIWWAEWRIRKQITKNYNDRRIHNQVQNIWTYRGGYDGRSSDEERVMMRDDYTEEL
jgi:hypothetical protein